MGKAEIYRKLADDCRKLAHRELSLTQRILLWLAVDAWPVEVAEHSEAEQSAEAPKAASGRVRSQR
jgi:hypothetical protein